MAVQLSLERCGVVLLDCSRGGTALGSQPQRSPTSATDCDSDPSGLTMDGQSRTNGQQAFKIVQWNAEGVRLKKTELQHFLKLKAIDVCYIQETHLSSSHRFFIRGYEVFWQILPGSPTERQTYKCFWVSQASPQRNSSLESSETSRLPWLLTDSLTLPGLMSTLMGLLRRGWKMVAAESTSDTQMVTPLTSQFLVAFSAPTIELRYWLLLQLQSFCWRVGKKWEKSPSSPTLFQPFRPSTQLIQTRWSKACTPPLPSWQLSSQYPSSGCLLMWDWQETKKQTDLQKSTVRLRRHRILSVQRGQDTSPLSVRWRLEEIQWWISGTPWPNLETGAGPADQSLPPAHRALWSECPSEEDWHFRHFPVWVRTSWPNPRPRPSVVPKVCQETSANMATGCWSDDQAVGLGRRPLPDGWFCGINWTEDLTCTAVDRSLKKKKKMTKIMVTHQFFFQ